MIQSPNSHTTQQESKLANLGSTLLDLRQRLESLSETPGLDAQVLLAHILGRTRAWVLAHPEAGLGPEEYDLLQQSVQRLQAGEPLPYVLGQWEFFGLSFLVSAATLIPRPETELLVEKALEWLASHRRETGARPTRVADVGTGTGCIAVSLAVHQPEVQISATDVSLPALQTARLNALRHGAASRIHLVQADLLPPGKDRFDLICANLPYIPTADLRPLAVFGREPTLALDGGLDGLDLIRRLTSQAIHRLADGGLVLLEIEASQGLAACQIVQAAFPAARVTLYQDLAGKDRLVAGQI